jgi:putative endonuclease
MKFYVYVIKSEDGYSYTGITSILTRRISEHNDKSFSKWTKRGNNWKIIYHEEFHTRSDAAKREKWLKSGAGREFIRSITPP